MSSLITCSTSDISLIPIISFKIKTNDYFRRHGLTRKTGKYRYSSQRVILPLPVSVLSFPHLQKECTFLCKPLVDTVAATGTDVAVEEPDSPIVDDDSGGAPKIQDADDKTDKSSPKSNISSAPTQTRRSRPGRKTEMPPVKNEELVPGASFTGKVRSIQPFGAFVDFGAFTDGLVHVSRLSDSFVKDVGSVVTVGQEVKVRLVEVNFDNSRISLTMRESEDNSKPQQRKDSPATATGDRPRPSRKGTPRPGQKREDAKSSKFVKGQELSGMVKNLTRSGAFISLPEGEEGFLPTSEEADGGLGSIMGTGSLLEIGQEVSVRVLRISRGQVTLTMKQEDDNSNLGAETVHGVIHSATNPFVLAFRQNKDISRFLDEREKVEKATKQPEEPLTSAETERETSIDIPAVQDQPTSSDEGVIGAPSELDETVEDDEPSSKDVVGSSLTNDNNNEASAESISSQSVDGAVKSIEKEVEESSGILEHEGSVSAEQKIEEGPSAETAEGDEIIDSFGEVASQHLSSKSTVDADAEERLPVDAIVKDAVEIPTPTAESEVTSGPEIANEVDVATEENGSVAGSDTVEDAPSVQEAKDEVKSVENSGSSDEISNAQIQSSTSRATEELVENQIKTNEDPLQLPQPTSETQDESKKDEQQILSPTAEILIEGVKDEQQIPASTAETLIEGDKGKQQILTPTFETKTKTVEDELQIPAPTSETEIESEKDAQIPIPTSETETESVKEELWIPALNAKTEIEGDKDEQQIPIHTSETETESFKEELQIQVPNAETEIKGDKDEQQILTPTSESETEIVKDELQIPAPTSEAEIEGDKDEQQIPIPTSETESESVKEELQIPVPNAETKIEGDKDEQQIPIPTSGTETESVKEELQIPAPNAETKIAGVENEQQISTTPSETETESAKEEPHILVPNAETEIEGDKDEQQVPTPIGKSENQIDNPDSEQSVNIGNLNGQNGNPSPKERATKGTISPALVKQLREETGAGMMDCKRALSETGGDIVNAQEFLRKKGLASAEKKASRVTAEGRIGSYIHDSRIGVLVEVNCETDFVSRGEIFKELVDDLAMQVAACPQAQYLVTEDVPEEIVNKETEIEMHKEDLMSKPEQIRSKIVEGRIRKRLEELALLEQPYIKNDKVAVKDWVKQTIAAVGENIKVTRFVRFNLGEGLQKKSQDFAAEVAAQTAAKKSVAAPAKEQPPTPESKEDSQKPPAVTVSAALVKQLREETGAGMMDCKKALAETGGDLEKAQEYLRKKGLSTADKKSSRLAAEGRIGSYIHDSRIGVLIEVNCETDFVGRSEKFKELVDDLAMQVVAYPQVQFVSTEEIPESIIKKEKEIEMQREDILSKPENIRERIVEGRISKRLGELALLEQPFIKDDSLLVKDLVKQTVAALGENIKVRRFVRFTLGDSDDGGKKENEA